MNATLRRTHDVVVPSRQVLTFQLGGELFGMDICHVREVIEYGELTRVPLMPNFVRGVINLRGEVVPVLDLSVRVGRSACDIHRRSCIVIVHLEMEGQDYVLGLIVDAVSEVVELNEDDIEPTPNFGLKLRTEFVEGIAKQNGKFVVLLNAANVLSLDELSQLVAEHQEHHETPATKPVHQG
jgi:purine-binding chemotaxis protein CheW